MAGNQKIGNRFWNGWTLALEAVSNAVLEVREEELTPDQAGFKDVILSFLETLVPDDDLLKPRQTNAEFAAKYACNLRTISNWRRQGCPLEDGQWRVLDWLSERHCLPKRTAAKFAKQIARRNGEHLDELTRLRQEGKLLLRLTRIAKVLGHFRAR